MVVRVVIFRFHHVPAHPAHRCAIEPIAALRDYQIAGISKCFHTLTPIIVAIEKEAGRRNSGADELTMWEDVPSAFRVRGAGVGTKRAYSTIRCSINTDGALPMIMVHGADNHATSAFALVDCRDFIRGNSSTEGMTSIAHKTIVIKGYAQHTVIRRSVEEGIRLLGAERSEIVRTKCVGR